MSATEILQKIEELSPEERQWLVAYLRGDDEQTARVAEDSAWKRFSANELLGQFAREDAIYDTD